MGKKKLVTIVGTGNYQPCTYTLGEYSYDSRYIQESLLHMEKEMGRKYDSIVCVMTEESLGINWEKYYRKNKFTGEETNDLGLKERLEAIESDAEIVTKIIPSGTDPLEQQEMFTVLYDSLEQDDEVTIDITHGYRFMPILYLSILSYARALKNIKVDNIYYGCFEVDEKQKPILDFKMFDDIIRWSTAAESFVKSGTVDMMQSLTTERYEAVSGKEKGQISGEKDFINAMQNFVDTIQTGRGNIGANVGNGIYKTYKDVEKKRVSCEKRIKNPLLIPLLDEMMKSIDEFGEQDAVKQGISVIRWCVDKKMIQQGYTALEETIKTYLCVQYGFGETVDKDIREKVVSKALTAVIKKKEDAGKTISYEEMKKELLENLPKEFIPRNYPDKYREIIAAVPENIVVFVAKVKEKRNDINHFGMSTSCASAKSLKKELMELAKEFEEIVEKGI